MATEPILTALDLARVQRSRTTLLRALFDYWELTKPEINFLIVITTGAGFWMGTAASSAGFPWVSLLSTVLATALVASGAATLNQLIEVRYDAQMRRTARRPVPSERISRSQALWFGVSLSIVGVVWLAV